MPELPRIIVAAFTTCCDCTDEIWPGEPAYPTGHGTRCLICQAQITPWVPDEPAGRGGHPVSADRITLPVPAHALPHRTSRELLELARAGLTEAEETRAAGMRYASAHLAALRTAAAVLAARAIPATPTGRDRPRVSSVWSLIVLVAPELSEWASFFAAGASKRSAAEAGIPRVVTLQEADELVGVAGTFIRVVAVQLGLTDMIGGDA
jgi:hypothetical protein